MSRFWSLEPEVAGDLGDGSEVDGSVHPPTVHKLQYRFSGWLGDELLETFPCFIVTESLASALVSAGFTGMCLDSVEVTTSEEFEDIYPGRKLPVFRWLNVTGTAGVDDLGLSARHTLIVSDAVLRLLRKHTISQCDVEEYKG